jgi:hypothetical protein
MNWEKMGPDRAMLLVGLDSAHFSALQGVQSDIKAATKSG